MRKNLYVPAILFCAMITAVPVYSAGPVLSKALRAAAGKDTVCNVWVFFNDRPAARTDIAPVSRKAALRRQRAGFRAGESDRPLDRGYIREIERRGGTLRRQFAWGNAASFSIHASRLKDISELKFVKSVTPVAVYIGRGADGTGLSKSSSSAVSVGGYGWHMDMVNVPSAHEYLKAKGLGDPGAGVLMAFFDGGFRLDHTAYSRVREKSSIASAYDFVDNDTTVSDTDSSYIAEHGDAHGTQTLALAAAYHPWVYMGAAWGARFALARTEDALVETRAEEDNWAAAVMWADSLGADIISSSLGYREFDSTSDDYTYEEMDGKTAIVSMAAAEAVARGVIVVNAMGNEGSYAPGTIAAPADADGVVGVGAVHRYRVIAGFSSTGPTADGRVKPDVVAPGVDVTVPHPYAPDLAAYTVASGTSFAAPIVSSIMALILQANPGISADAARERLYGSCRFTQEQTDIDNRYGRGVPDALRAVMAETDIFVKITDRAGIPLQGARINAGGGRAYLTNDDGCSIVAANGRGLPIQLKITYRGETLHTLTVDSLPYADVIALDNVDAVSMREGLRIFKTVVKNNGTVRGRLFFSGAEAGTPVAAAICTVNGRTIWNQNLQLAPDGSAEFVWDCKIGTKRVAAGVYLLTVRYGGSAVTGRIVIGN